MKVVLVVTVFVVAAFAEPPISKSYLPPSSQGGYPQGPQGFGSAPQVVAARSLDHGHGHGHDNHAQHGHHDQAANGFARNGASGHGAQGRFAAGSNQGYDHNASPFGRNALGESSEPANYNFEYMVNDYQEGTDFGHHEERQEERAQGEYHVVLPDGRKQTVSYEADERGFKPHITYEDTEDASARNGGYDANANNARSQDHHGNGYSGGNHHGNGANGRSFGSHGNGYNSAARSSGY